MKIFGLLLLLASSAVGADQCLIYTDVRLEGVLSVETFAGPPNYESVKSGDKAETYFFLSLPEPLCVVGTPGESLEPSESDVSKVQIVLNQKGSLSGMKRLVGARVACSGRLFHAISGHHHSAVLLEGVCHAV